MEAATTALIARHDKRGDPTTIQRSEQQVGLNDELGWVGDFGPVPRRFIGTDLNPPSIAAIKVQRVPPDPDYRLLVDGLRRSETGITKVAPLSPENTIMPDVKPQ